MATPSSLRTSPTDKYSPPGGYNLPQSSIDRSKVTDPATGEVKAGGTAIARRSLAKPVHGQSAVDTQLTAGKVMGAAAATAGAAAATGDAAETAPAEALAASTPNDESAEPLTETAEEQPSSGAAMAFADAPEKSEAVASAGEAPHEQADQQVPLASAARWSAGAEAPEQNLAA